MKYKLIGTTAFLVALAIMIGIAAVPTQENTRYHQHISAPPKAECSHGEDVFCTHLPLVEIDTYRAEIPGKAIDGNIYNIATTPDGQSEILCKIAVVDHEETNNHTADDPQLNSSAYINVRGYSSRTFDKSGYAIRLVTEDGQNNPQSMMGMSAHHEWALHGPILDKTLMRNYLWYNLAGEIMDYAPNVRFCEVILNGEYMGVYVMTETITAGREGARLNLSVDKKDNTFSGYLLRLDRGSGTPIKNIDPFSVYTYRFQNKVNIEYPGAANLTQELAESIRQDFSAFEKALYSFDYDNKTYGYQTMIDVQSFIDYFLINELALNYDAGSLSTYIYKDMDGKLRLCVWDFNSASDNYQESVFDVSGFELQNGVWYFMLFKDEDFVNALIDRYYELRQSYFSDEYLQTYIDEVQAYLGDAIDRNYEKWGYSFGQAHDLLVPTERNPRSYEEAVSDMEDVLLRRAAWMDENIETLRQYSAESKVKKFNEHTD